MSGLSRRDLIRASAGAAAISVPITALSSSGVSAAGATADDVEIDGIDGGSPSFDVTGPVLFSVKDVAAGEVSILHGTSEVIVRDRALVNRIIRAANARAAV